MNLGAVPKSWQTRGMALKMVGGHWCATLGESRGAAGRAHRQSQTRLARLRLRKHGCTPVRELLVGRSWNLAGCQACGKRLEKRCRIMLAVLRHASAEWRQQRSANALGCEPRIELKMNRRRTGGAPTKWDALLVKWCCCGEQSRTGGLHNLCASYRYHCWKTTIG